MAADEKAKAELRAAFDEMMAALARARDAIGQELAELFERYHWSEGSPAHGG